MSFTPSERLSDLMKVLLLSHGLNLRRKHYMSLLAPREDVPDKTVEAIYFDRRNLRYISDAEKTLRDYEPDEPPRHALLVVPDYEETKATVNDILSRCHKKGGDDRYSQKEINDFRYDLIRFALALSLKRSAQYTAFKGGLSTVKSLKDIARNKKGTITYYRGQFHGDWELVPSFLREIKDSVFLDHNAYTRLTNDRRLNEKYEASMGETSNNVYERSAFFQHACSFSPLIDFTFDPIVATTFAVSCPEKEEDDPTVGAMVYSFQAKEGPSESDGYRVYHDLSQANRFIRDEFRLIYLNETYVALRKTYALKAFDERGNLYERRLRFDTIAEFIKALTPSFAFIDLPTNDRMRYQKGVFLVFHDCLCLDGCIYFELNPNFSLHQCEIMPEGKSAIRKEIARNHPGKDYEHLMNPYLYFQE